MIGGDIARDTFRPISRNLPDDGRDAKIDVSFYRCCAVRFNPFRGMGIPLRMGIRCKINYISAHPSGISYDSTPLATSATKTHLTDI